MMNLKKNSFQINDTKISVNIKAGNKGDIVLIHGLGCSKESFNELLQSEYLKGYRLIAPDLPGFGDSSKPEEYSYTMAQHASCLKELLKKLNVTNPIIIAHSMGGAIALLLMEKLTSVKYFFSLEGNLVGEDCTISKAVASRSEEDFIKIYNRNPVKYLFTQFDSEADSNPIGYYRSAVSLVEMSESGKLLKKYKDLSCPKAYIFGSENRNIKAVKALAGYDVVEIAECGHFMLNDNPQDTYSAIENRLKA